MNTFVIGKSLEDEVAFLYKQITGTIKVEQNINISGIQVDVYVEIISNDGTINKYAIDAKNFTNNVPADHIRKCITDFNTMKINHKIDQGIIIAAKGFTQDGNTAARDANIRLVTLSELKRHVLDFTPYLEKWIEQYEKNDLRKMIKYLPLTARDENNNELGQLDRFLTNWISQDGKHITLLGNYGTGKSTTLRRLMWIQSKEYLKNPENNRIPIFIELKGFRHAPKTRSLITDVLVNEYGLNNLNFAKFQELNSKGCFLILLDGFDEMVDKVIDGTIQEHFNELSTLACDDSKVILSCRTHYFSNHEQVLDVYSENIDLFSTTKDSIGYKILFLNSFKEKDINDYIEAYFKGDSKKYMGIIKSTYDLYSLAETPILLNMIVESLPDMIDEGTKINRPAIYDTFTNKWLKRDRWRIGLLHTEDRLFFCEQLALHFYTSQKNYVSWDELPRYIKQYFGERVKTQTSLDIFDSDVRTCNFLSRKESSGEYSFVHKSFMEYFVAKHFHKLVNNKVINGLDELRNFVKSKVIYEFLLEMLIEDDINILMKSLVPEDNSDFIYTSSISKGNCAFFVSKAGYSVEKATLDTAIFDGFSFCNESFNNANLGSSSFKSCKIKNVSYIGALLGYASFENAELINVDFTNALLSKANFKDAIIDNKTLMTIAKSKNWGTAVIDIKLKEKIDKEYRSNSDIECYSL